MPIPESLQAPSWVDTGAVLTGGLDLLGLRLPVQTIGGTLLDGITSVTPSIRYLAMRAWMIQQYGQSGQPDAAESFLRFAARLESAVVLANLSVDKQIQGLIGANEANERLKSSNSEIEISPLTVNSAAAVYAGPSDQLGISNPRGDAVPALIDERGAPLARAVESQLRGNPLLGRLLGESGVVSASRDELAELSSVARIDHIPDEEIEILTRALIPQDPLPRERARIGTYSALLVMARDLRARPNEQQFLNAACSVERFGEPLLDPVADGWTAYCVRDALAVVHEATFAAVMDQITSSSDEGKDGVDRRELVASLLESVEDHSAPLRSLGLLDTDESVLDLSFRELRSRIATRITAGAEKSGAIARWPSSTREPQVYRLALRSGAGALTLAVVAWILADARVGNGVRNQRPELRRLSHQGARRFGIREIVLPTVDRWYNEDRPVREVAAEIADRTVQQHLRIAWARLQSDPLRRDVALLLTEDLRIFPRGKRFAAGRTVSRLQQAISWLVQLKLVNTAGITPYGLDVLSRALAFLSQDSSQ